MYISTKDWKAYISKLRKLNDEAAQKIVLYVQQNGFANTDALILYCYSVVEKYGTGSAALSAAMYDATALMQGAAVPAAEMASLANYSDVAKTVHGVLKTSSNVDELAGAVARWVKKAGCDTTLQNAVRDSHSNTMYSSGRRKYGKKANTGAQFAWIPSGDTCAFCLALAANGWQYQTREGAAMHAEHIHSNCDCTYAVRFGDDGGIDGYDPDAYKEQIESALKAQGMDGDLDDYSHGAMNPDVLNAVRRQNYAENKEAINEQKKSAEEKRKELNSSKAEETFTFMQPPKAILDFEEKSRNLKNERAIITDQDGNVFDESKGKGRMVTIDEPNAAGYIFSHNHPEPVTFSVADVRGFERAGYKQIRAAANDRTFILEAMNPVQHSSEDSHFTIAMFSRWQELDEESAAKRKEINAKAMEIQDREKRSVFAQKEYTALAKWREDEEETWLKDNAPEYGYRYGVEFVSRK